MLAPLGCSDRNFFVRKVGATDDHRVNVRRIEQFLVMVELGQREAGLLGEVG